MDVGKFVSEHKTAVMITGAVVAGAVIYSFLHRGSSTSTPTTYNPASGSTVSPTQYLVPYNAYFGSAGTPDGGSTSSPSITSSSSSPPSSNVPSSPPSQNQPTTVSQGITSLNNSTTTSGGNSSGVADQSSVQPNPYPVGTTVASGESIVQSIYDPNYGWVDLTSKGGIYTGPGFGVSGSGYSPNWQGTGRVQLASGGSQVVEYNAKGQQVGTYSLAEG